VSAADDLTQDVFLIVHRKLAEVQTKSALRSWLFGVTRRVCKDYRRALGRRGVHLELAGQHEADTAEDPQEKMQARQALQTVERFASELDEERRALFFLALIEGLNVNDVAETLGWNANTTYSRVRVLRQQLAQRLGLDSKDTRGNHGRA
jgi:RNA polymerase sigma-70 factor (ECF subfamily)